MRAVTQVYSTADITGMVTASLWHTTPHCRLTAQQWAHAHGLVAAVAVPGPQLWTPRRRVRHSSSSSNAA